MRPSEDPKNFEYEPNENRVPLSQQLQDLIDLNIPVEWVTSPKLRKKLEAYYLKAQTQQP